ncbi:MAG: molybdopterin-synthase adenylyltransferase MoeB [Myxococcales bacterium]|nr:molybdopterin-synthase adenylyltransferase MoeB [Myxococcales bacterium]
MPGKPAFTASQFERYQRHLNLPEFGAAGQRKLLEGSVLMIGAGGLGSPIALYLAAAGVGRLGIVDFDVVDVSNLQRQVLYSTEDVGRPKHEAARERVSALNPEIAVETHPERLHAGNALEILGAYDVIIDGTDNFPTRYLTNDACVLLGKPCVYGAILRFEGQASVFDARRGPCYRCLFPEPPPPGAVPSCAEGGVLGILPGVIGLLQATEAVKLLAGVGEPLIGRFVQYDALDMRFAEFRFAKDPDCAICGKNPTIRELIDYEGFCGVAAEPREVVSDVTSADLLRMREEAADHLLLDVRNPDEYETARIEGSRLLPLPELESRVNELADWKERKIIVHCHRGARSERACRILRDAGFQDVENLAGGIDAWSLTVDGDVPRYD